MGKNEISSHSLFSTISFMLKTNPACERFSQNEKGYIIFLFRKIHQLWGLAACSLAWHFQQSFTSQGYQGKQIYLPEFENHKIILGAQMDARSHPCSSFRRQNIFSLVLPFKSRRKFQYLIRRNRHPILDSTSGGNLLLPPHHHLSSSNVKKKKLPRGEELG